MSSSRRSNPKPVIDEISKLTAPEAFRNAITMDPFASTYTFDYDAYRGAPIDPADTYPGGTEVPLSGFYLDIDGAVIDYYNEGDLFPHLGPGGGPGGHYVFLTDRRNATVSDLRFMALRRGWQGNVRELHSFWTGRPRELHIR
ncbi:MAG: hypothetical protein IT333_07930 [Thermomicrobiales bacterium]|nr:hypothetical protein [Thermomicrobiales bacterium]